MIDQDRNPSRNKVSIRDSDDRPQTININVHSSALIGLLDVFQCYIVITLHNLFHLHIQLQQMTKIFSSQTDNIGQIASKDNET